MDVANCTLYMSMVVPDIHILISRQCGSSIKMGGDAMIATAPGRELTVTGPVPLVSISSPFNVTPFSMLVRLSVSVCTSLILISNSYAT